MKRMQKILSTSNKREPLFSPLHSDVPPYMKEWCEWIRSYGLKAEGIFRLSGETRSIADAMRKLEKGKTVPLSPSTNPHFVAGLIKLWLCDLDDPLLTYELHEAFVAAIQPESTEERVELLREVVGLLPPGCKAVFKEHLRLMADIAKNEEVNKMTVHNVAVVFAPMMLRHRTRDLAALLEMNKIENDIIAECITHWREIFSSGVEGGAKSRPQSTQFDSVIKSASSSLAASLQSQMLAVLHNKGDGELMSAEEKELLQSAKNKIKELENKRSSRRMSGRDLGQAQTAESPSSPLARSGSYNGRETAVRKRSLSASQSVPAIVTPVEALAVPEEGRKRKGSFIKFMTKKKKSKEKRQSPVRRTGSVCSREEAQARITPERTLSDSVAVLGVDRDDDEMSKSEPCISPVVERKSAPEKASPPRSFLSIDSGDDTEDDELLTEEERVELRSALDVVNQLEFEKSQRKSLRASLGGDHSMHRYLETLIQLAPEDSDIAGRKSIAISEKSSNYTVIEYEDGMCYKGDVVDGEWHGRGRVYYTNGDFYDGSVCNGKLSGLGTLVGADGTKYVGEFVDDEKHGRGIYTNEKGDVYEGDFEHNIPQGEGDLMLANGDKYVGEFKNGIPHGMGEYTFTNGDVYIGEMENDEFHGFGEYKGASGSTYVGEFVRGSKTGTGTLTMKSGAKYEGSFENGKFHGNGVLTFADESRAPVSAWFENNKAVGPPRDE